MKITDYLPYNPAEVGLVQGKVEKDLLRRVRERMKKEKVGWDQFLTAACKAYLEEPVRKK